MSIHLHIRSEALDPQVCIEQVSSPAAGAINTFIGTVRENTKGRKVLRLEFEAYEAMALREMQKIAEQAMEQWPLTGFSMHHRVGVLGIGALAVVIAVASPHRAAGFEACQFAIDTLKETVPIWKKEFFEDGEVWVAAHP